MHFLIFSLRFLTGNVWRLYGGVYFPSAQDEKDLSTAEYDFETVHNIREGRVELDVTMTSVLKQWNTTVQYWLYNTVYRSTPGTKVFRLVYTIVGYWL